MAKVTELTSPADAEALLAASHEGPVALLKHSVACAASARGHAEFLSLDDDGLPLYVVVVQRARAASNLLASALGVRHETPQAMVLRDGAAVLVQSHGAIRASSLRAAASDGRTAAPPAP